MATPELSEPTDRAVLARVRSQLARLGPGCHVIGIRSAGPPRWQGPPALDLDGRRLRIATCSSVLAVLDVLADAPADETTVLLTDVGEPELGDAVLARLHRGTLLEADRYTLLGDVLEARGLDPRIRREVWLVDALIALAAAGAIPSTAGATLSKPRAVGLVAAARLGVDPEQVDLPTLVGAFDAASVRAVWRGLPGAERAGIVEYLAERHGPAVAVFAALAERHDDVLAELLVAQAITSAPGTDTHAAAALGGFLQARFVAPRPSRIDLAAAGAAAVVYAADAPSARLGQQVRDAERELEELGAPELAVHSPILPRGFVERLAVAAQRLDEAAIADVVTHQQAPRERHRVDRLRAAVRLHRWLKSASVPQYATASEGVAHHAGELAWVDRALSQVRAGDADPRVATVLRRIERRAAEVRGGADAAFAARLAADATTPAEALAVETVLPALVVPLVRSGPVLLLVVDGMSGAVAGDLTDAITDRRTGWTEIVRSGTGAREAVLAALPTETTFSRTSLFCAALRTGDAKVERSAFGAHRFWPGGGAVLVHKAGVAGREGADLGAELEEALGADGPAVVAVVLNTVDDALVKGRQSIDPAWRPEDVGGLPQLLDRAAAAGRTVVLTSDHGHVLEHGSEYRPRPGAGARWRPDDGAMGDGEVVVEGPRVLVPGGRAILAATEQLRYGGRAPGYHGGATLAEVAIPLVVLVPPGVDVPEAWFERPPAAPAWWTGETQVASPPTPVTPKAARRNQPVGDGLFDLSTTPVSRGGRLVRSSVFGEAHGEIPANRAPAPTVFAAVIDVLVAAGGRLPLADVAEAAGTPGRNPRGLVSVMGRVLNRDGYPVLTLVDGGRAVALNAALLDEQFPPDGD